MFGPRIGSWGWLPLTVGYWTGASLVILLYSGKKGIRGWFQPSHGGAVLVLLSIAILVSPAALRLLPDTWRLFLKASVWLPTIFFVLVNPFVEEGYWRGLLLDAIPEKKQWIGVLYSNTLFVVNKLWIGTLVIGVRNPVSLVYQFIFGLLMARVYLKTRSLH
jgi:uncharacterized protein